MEKIDFDQLSKNAYHADANLQDKDALWLEVFKLREWFFIAQGAADQIQPFVGTVEVLDKETLWIHAFTDVNRATYFAKSNNLFLDKLATPILTVNNDGKVLEWIDNQKGGKIKGIFFNGEGHGFFTSLNQLRPIKTHLQTSYPGEIK